MRRYGSVSIALASFAMTSVVLLLHAAAIGAMPFA